MHELSGMEAAKVRSNWLKMPVLAYTSAIGLAGASFAVPWMRSVFSSASVKVVQFGEGAPPGGPRGGHSGRADGWRAVTRVLRSCAATAGSLANTLRDDSVTTIFPDDCGVCGGPMTAWSAAPVCNACIERVGPQQGALCEICGEALGMESARFAAAMGASACTACRLAPPSFTRAVAYASYEDEFREMLHLLKYERVLSLADSPLGKWLASAVLELKAEAAEELTVIAVPLFASRERQRGFNQSVILADAAVAKLKKVWPGLSAAHRAMERVRDTDAQYGLTPHARRKNLRGAFRVVDPAAIAGKEVLLVDDIMTTGATARECARVLVRAGAAKVWVATLARVQAESFVAEDVAMWDAAAPGVATGFV
jgi:ComF family protein